MKTNQESGTKGSLIELKLTPEMSIIEFQDICKEKIHAFPNIYRKGALCSKDTLFGELGLSEEHNISMKPTNDIGDIIQTFEKIIKDKRIHMLFYYANRPWAVTLGDVKIKETTKLPSLIKSWLISTALKFAIKYAD